ncbi:hypothetical protein IH979_03365 [Patescibacteria group bacterium]|nr:hypothetical protein [Patescibacteria group bacterium]
MKDFLIKSAKLASTPDAKHPMIEAELLSMPDDQGSIFSLIKILGRKDETRNFPLPPG